MAPDRLKHLTGHFVHTGLFNIFTLFTRKLDRLHVQFWVPSRWFRQNRTPKRTNCQVNRLNISLMPFERSLSRTTITHLLKFHTKAEKNSQAPVPVCDVEGGAIGSKNSTFGYFDGTAWTPRLRSPTPIMAPGCWPYKQKWERSLKLLQE